jgi:hypothetical protein
MQLPIRLTSIDSLNNERGRKRRAQRFMSSLKREVHKVRDESFLQSIAWRYDFGIEGKET